MAHSTEHHADHGHHHIVPVRILVTVFAALIALTIITVVTAQIDLGALNVPLALAIACTKASLVILFFMALKWDTATNRLAAGMGIAFVMIFLTFTLFDTLWRGAFGNVEGLTIQEMEARAEELRSREPSAAQLRVAPADYVAGTDTTTAAADTAETAPQAPTEAPAAH